MDDRQSRTQLVRTIGWIVILTNVVFLIPMWLVGETRGLAMSLVFVSLDLLVVVSISWLHQPMLAAHALGIVGVTHILCAIALTGGVQSVATTTILLVPAAISLMIGVRAGWAWLLFSGFVLILLNLAGERAVLGAERPLSTTQAGWLGLSVIVPIGVCLQAAMAVFATQRERAQQALQDANLRLEDRVRARTVELQVEVESRRLAEQRASQANASKTAFLMNMSHELRTPLNAVQGYAELVSDELEDGLPDGVRSVQEDLDHIVSASQHLLGLIDGILEFARVEAGQLVFRPVHIEATTLVQATIALLAPTVTARGNTVRFSKASVMSAPVVADPAWVRQILINLITNANQNTDNGAIVVTVGLDSTSVQLSVTDTGAGIGPDLLPRIFERFTRGERASNSGTGLGLAISQSLAHKMGGTLTASSILGKGSTFVLTLPRVPVR